MGKAKKVFRLKHMLSAVFMIAALAWLTVSLPYVYKVQQELKQLSTTVPVDQEEDGTNPFANTTEEKNESSVNTLSEYLHDLHTLDHHFIILTKYYKCHPSGLYLAHHPELLSPPPEA